MPDANEPKTPKPPGAAIIKFGWGSVLVPVVAFLIGILLTNVIPGCHCNEAMGCRGCGADELVDFLISGGFMGAVLALFTVLPLSLVIAAIVKRSVSRRQS